ncbi:MAG: amidase [Candidatus Velthaea sp.]
MQTEPLKAISPPLKTLRVLREQLDARTITSRALSEEALARIGDPRGEDTRTFTTVFTDAALAAADAADALRAAGVVVSPLAGIPVSVKDLFDVAGRVTTAGSRVLAGGRAAQRDADIVARLRQAGAVIIGTTNMTEFAYTGLGINPHFGTPRNPHDRATGRIPGGSSSGAAVSVSDRMAAVAIGTDTGGSVRIPAALCGLAGFKPSAQRVPTGGAVPLSTTLDSIGPIGVSVDCCARVDAILSNATYSPADAMALKNMRFLAPVNHVRADEDPAVRAAFEAAVQRLRSAGALVEERELPPLARIPALLAKGGFAAAESFAWHRPYLESDADRYDPFVFGRIMRGSEQTAAEYIDLLAERRALIREVAAAASAYDALVMPTVAVRAPAIAELDDAEVFAQVNALVLRNTTVANLIDGCALSIPCHAPDAAPVGFMLVGTNGSDSRILRIGAAVEALLQSDA